MTGRTFSGRYEIRDRIGIGGMAEVYQAQDNVLGRVVAVKVMLPQYAADADFTRRFRQEAAAAANLQSPYIVNVYDWGQDEGTYFIVMEFVRGSDLKTAINQRGAINQRKVAEIGSQVCQALTVAHNQDIVHRDIKPQNIMVQPDGNVKVMDFGIARAKNSVKQKTSAVLGTAHYISPEQAQGKELTAASDIYSLGVVMYEATTGKLPFDGPDAVSVALMQVQDEPLPPSAINPNIDPALEDIILCAMAKSPADRFATANDMRLALNDYLAGRPVNLGGASDFTSASTRVIGTVPPAVPPMAPVDATQAMPGVGGAGAVTNPALSGAHYRVDPPPKSKKPLFIALGAVAAIIVLAVVVFNLLGGGGAEDKDVPVVTGMTEQAATELLEAEGFTVRTDYTFDDSVPEGTVVKQDPAGGAKAAEKARVTITVSNGAEQVVVPNFYQMTVDEAKRYAEEYGLKLSADPADYSDTVEKDLIMSQSPASGSKVDKGSTVTYVLSLGTETVNVPGVVGKSQSDATNTLSNAGFKVETKKDYSDSVASGNVISQSVTGPAKPGTTVTLTISQGPEPKPEPEQPSTSTGGNNSNQGGTTPNPGGSTGTDQPSTTPGGDTGSAGGSGGSTGGSGTGSEGGSQGGTTAQSDAA
ncbi:MAG: Stk1 family PASTA domain-containing Ser/Thr kinase [Eggerthellaceae bacterium]|nr:Stk1 family PASTA domain-containing Ser/Thr kinase [Eggerthellaceae bacterium]